jgi:polyphosphate glucokinase
VTTQSLGAMPIDGETSAVRTLAIDCGGSGIKGSVLDDTGVMMSERFRVPVPYPMSPADFVTVLDEVAARCGPFDRVTIGVPGMVRHGVVITTPHYITVAGPHSDVDPLLQQEWLRWPVQEVLADHWQRPVRVLNDAQVHGASVISGIGLEVMLTLGTGLGCAVYDDGQVVPKLEMSRATVRKGVIYDEWIGAAARRRIGNRKWTRRVLMMIAELRPVFVWDHLYLGGGETKKLREPVPDDVTTVANIAGISGGVRVWELSSS